MLRKSWNADFLSTKEKAQRYNGLERERSEHALANKYNRMVLDGDAPLIVEPRDTSHTLLTIWRNTNLSLEERADQVNRELYTNYSVGKLVARYSDLIKRNPLWVLMVSRVEHINEDGNQAGPWEPGEVIRLMEIWRVPLNVESLEHKAMHIMSISGNDLSLASMEYQWRDITGIMQFSIADLKQQQRALDAESLFRRGQQETDWTRLEGNALRRVCRDSSDDWNERTVEWAKLCRKERFPRDWQLDGRL